ncbi:hypothetical protein EZ428_10715 [Pedobacter frigiditerrae]|uniref:Uncharacterized protein n=1 Tax=Pedobacter frigiditerrae TaxID=2530452 RepID=A0A4R0N1H7_9SPHI|nr:hypothetical protein [Pedobacter frigiditerrae]TCC92192.1 hypothetical protein EZ428_10715 [Pedobacter frigiditerrae]
MKNRKPEGTSRRNFLKLSSLASFSFLPTVNALAKILKIEPKYIEDFFTDEFHYFDNNLTNLHFFFINAKVTGKLLKPLNVGQPAYMVVKIPQQHIAEQVIKESDLALYTDNKKNVQSKISGFSYLAFHVFPKVKSTSSSGATVVTQKKQLYLDQPETLLNWTNATNFELIIPKKEDFKSFNGNDWNTFKINKVTEITDTELNPSTGYISKLYQDICKKIFVKETAYPITVLEIPEGLLVSPYSLVGGRAFIDNYQIAKTRFLINYQNRSVVRTVEEIWSPSLFFDSINGPIDPLLRAVGYVPRQEAEKIRGNDECPKDEFTFLPSLLDKKELVYLTSLGRGDNDTKDWNIETKGLTFTGLGAIAKFHYKNLTPPKDTDLAEYEHHITMGRDEYIKVARLGVISVTGQRALHIKIGQRKIVKGESYMDFKEYIEIVQKEINYFDSQLFIGSQQGQILKEPKNFIHARAYPSVYNQPNKVIHSIDLPSIETDNTFRDSVLWSLPNYLPNHPYSADQAQLNWHTNYRRWPFKKIEVVTLISKPIETDKTKKPTALTYEHAACDCATVFWPVLEKQLNGKDQDCYLDFIGYDWNDQAIKFSSTFLFIRKKIIECESNLEQLHTEIYNNRFINQRFERRSIRFANSKIALTPDFSTAAINADSENKSNVAKVDHLEYYFSLCLEPTRSISSTEVVPDVARLPNSSIFNERFFPLYPQVKEAQLYIDNIQSYTPQPLVSVVEYNDDFINYGYEGNKIVVIKGKQQATTYNKGKLIFNHTAAFMSGKAQIYDLKDGVLNKRNEASQGYQKIKEAFGSAGAAIGGLVNPDFDIQTIGLIKQSISVGKDINKKYEELNNFTGKFEKFNPSDLLRQAPEIFNGISLLDILQEIFPDYEAPVNEIKNITAQLENLQDGIINNPIYQNIKKELKDVNDQILKYIKFFEDAQAQIETYKKQLISLKDKLNFDWQFADLENLVENKIAQYKIPFLQYENDIVTFKGDVESILNNVITDLLAKTEVAYALYHQLIAAKKTLVGLKSFTQDGKAFSGVALGIIQNYIDQQYFNASKYVILNLNAAKKEEILRTRDQIKATLKASFEPYLAKYNEFTKGVAVELKAKEDYLNSQKNNNLLKAYQTAAKALDVVTNEIQVLKEQFYFKSLTEEIKLKGNAVDRELTVMLQGKFDEVQTAAKNGIDFINSFDLPFYIDQYEKAAKDFEIIKSKLKFDDKTLSTILGTIAETTGFQKQVDQTKKLLINHYLTVYDNTRADIDKLVLNSNNIVNAYKYITESFIWEGLKDSIPEQKAIKEILGITNDVTDIVLSISKFEVPEIQEIRREIEEIARQKLQKLEDDLREEFKKYELLLREQVKQATSGIVGKVNAEIEKVKQQVLANPENQELIANFNKLNELFNLLTSVTKKEINYDWQTSSFKNAEFGIVSFIASTSPKTSLTVKVRNTIHFEPLKFPAIVSKVDSLAENRLNNFGISLLKAIIINFNEVSFVAGTNQKSKFEVKIRDVQFAGAFSFVQALESIFSKLLGDNFSVKIQPLSVEIQYLLPIPYLGAPSFGFKDILFKILYTLHFNQKPMELGVGIGTPENRTKLSVGIYTGLFYFIVIGNPKQGITTIEVSIEFGGYFGLNLGPLRGEVKLVVGLYYRKDLTGVIIEGYFLCEGRVKLWFVMVTARFYMGVRSQGGYVEGRCTVSYEIRISRFFKRSFSATYYKKVAGASPGNNQSGNTQRIANKYKALNGFSSDKAIDFAPMQNAEERKTRPLTQTEWEKFINSYID